mmetsp:Transcript_33295/g.49610  ORF Transcript_33295/g.49610 Transcript_33295/m.49610 type:complete len:523 (-) Transcript_33295:147-1715(-)
MKKWRSKSPISLFTVSLLLSLTSLFEIVSAAAFTAPSGTKTNNNGFEKYLPHSTTAQSNSILDPSSITLGPYLGNGTFGTVRFGRRRLQSTETVTLPTEVEEAIIVKSAHESLKNAASYLTTEAYLNRRLCLEGSQSRHVAPYLGECWKEDEDEERFGEHHFLVWKESGNNTLETYITMPEGDGYRKLAVALGLSLDDNHHVLGREVLHQLLSALSYIHAHGVVHRDIKPANILVDEHTHSLQLIDFGSACDMGNWVDRRGFQAGKGPLSILYCAPEEFLEENHPYAFDIYSAAVCWLRLMIPGFRHQNDLYNFRLAVRDKMHVLESWQENATLTDQLPEGWEQFFSCAEGRHASRLISSMMKFKPGQRPSASEAMLGKYLNPGCIDEEETNPPAVLPWSLPSYLDRWSRRSVPEECVLSDEFLGKVFSVELQCPPGIVLKEERGKEGRLKGVAVSALIEGGSALKSKALHAGDVLLSIGPIDVEELGLEKVIQILGKWPKKSVPLQFLRDDKERYTPTVQA